MSKMIVTANAMPEKYQGWGGRGLIAKILNEEIDPQCDPLGDGNKLIICTGLLAGTPASTANRLSIGGKSRKARPCLFPNLQAVFNAEGRGKLRYLRFMV